MSPLLFSVYINEIVIMLYSSSKYADDVALTACLKDEFSQYYQYVEMLVSWFDNSFLIFLQTCICPVVYVNL